VVLESIHDWIHVDQVKVEKQKRNNEDQDAEHWRTHANPLQRRFNLGDVVLVDGNHLRDTFFNRLGQVPVAQGAMKLHA